MNLRLSLAALLLGVPGSAAYACYPDSTSVYTTSATPPPSTPDVPTDTWIVIPWAGPYLSGAPTIDRVEADGVLVSGTTTITSWSSASFDTNGEAAFRPDAPFPPGSEVTIDLSTQSDGYFVEDDEWSFSFTVGTTTRQVLTGPVTIDDISVQDFEPDDTGACSWSPERLVSLTVTPAPGTLDDGGFLYAHRALLDGSIPDPLLAEVREVRDDLSTVIGVWGGDSRDVDDECFVVVQYSGSGAEVGRSDVRCAESPTPTGITGETGPTGDTGATAGTGDTAAPPTYTYAADIAPILVANCTGGCHIPGSSGGFNISGISDLLALSNDVPSMPRITPGDPTTSYIWHKLNNTQASVGGSGSRMPLGGGPLGAPQLSIIETWILEGAPE
mgnify:CR=1 FL=1